MLPAVLAERTLSFSQAADACPEVGGKKPSPKTVYAWCDLGILVGGRRVKLECAKVGGRRVTSAEALERFFAATAGGEPEPAPRSPAVRNRASERAREFLRAEFAKV